MKLSEVTRRELVRRMRTTDKSRYNKRLEYKPTTYQGVNLDDFFNKGRLTYTADIHDYKSTISFDGALDELKEQLRKTGRVCTLRDVIIALSKAIDKSDDIRVNCTCPDYCLTGDTKISLLDGRELDILSIVDEFNSGKDLWVYSTDKNGDFKPGKIIDAWLTGTSTNTYEVTLDNGEVIRCTGNHPFMLRDGSYKNAQDLEVGQSLMPLYRRIGAKGYEQVKLNSSDVKSDYRSTYKLVADEIYQDEINSIEVPQIHHIDFNKSNNDPSNLRVMSRDDHWKLHYELVSWRIENDEEFYKATLGKGHDYWKTDEGRSKKSEEMSRSISNWWESLSDEEKSEHSKKCWESIDKELWRKHLSEGRKNFFNSMTPEERSEYSRKSINSPEAINKAAESRSRTLREQYANGDREVNQGFINATKSPRSEEWKSNCSKWMSKANSERMSQPDYASRIAKEGYKTLVVKVLIEMASKGIALTEDNYDRYEYHRKPKWYKQFSSWDEVMERYSQSQNNHRVVSIKKLDGEYEIYDITVDKWHNFRLAAGVVVSNTYRYRYWATVSDYAYGDTEMEKPQYDKTNKDGNGAVCKHLASLLSNKNYLIKVSSVINNYIKLNYNETYDYLYDKEPIDDEDEVDDAQISMFDDEDEVDIKPKSKFRLRDTEVIDDDDEDEDESDR